jgi:transcription elongation factor Elf1
MKIFINRFAEKYYLTCPVCGKSQELKIKCLCVSQIPVEFVFNCDNCKNKFQLKKRWGISSSWEWEKV